MDMLDNILEYYNEEDILVADGFDSAIIGVCEDFNSPIRLIYSVKKCLDILSKDMSYEESLEYFSFNVSNAYVGKNTPIWCYDNF